jgi:hypothetical protein
MAESVIGSGDIHSGDYFTPADLLVGDTVTLYNRIFFVSAPAPRIDTLCTLAVRPLPCLSGVLDPCTAISRPTRTFAYQIVCVLWLEGPCVVSEY